MTVTGGHLHPQVSAASGGDCSTSQADSASSILVTRSTLTQASSGTPHARRHPPGHVLIFRAISVPLARWSEQGRRASGASAGPAVPWRPARRTPGRMLVGLPDRSRLNRAPCLCVI